MSSMLRVFKHFSTIFFFPVNIFAEHMLIFSITDIPFNLLNTNKLHNGQCLFSVLSSWVQVMFKDASTNGKEHYCLT